MIKKCLILIPVYNDFELISTIIDDIDRLNLNIFVTYIIINDGSNSSTHTLDFQKSNVLYYELPYNMGLGFSTEIGLKLIQELSYDLMIRIDSDGQHPVSVIPLMLQKIEKNSDSICWGIRTNHMKNTGIIPILKKMMKYYFIMISSLLTKHKFVDVNSGCYAISKNAAEKLSATTYERYPEIQILFTARQLGIDIFQVNINQKERQYGKSSISLLKSFILFYQFHLNIINFLLKKKKVTNACN